MHCPRYVAVSLIWSLFIWLPGCSGDDGDGGSTPSDTPSDQSPASSQPPDSPDPGTDTPASSTDRDRDGYTADEDCNDNDASVNPGEDELCDLKDNDCDEKIDEGVQSTFFADLDQDGYGDDAASVDACTAPRNYVDEACDCDDNDDEVYEGAEEICDLKDNDCDNATDEDTGLTYYPDADGDGYGIEAGAVTSCQKPEGFTPQAGDCAATDATTYPGAPEACDNLDNDCDGLIAVSYTHLTLPTNREV